MTENDFRYMYMKQIYNTFKSIRPNEKIKLVSEFGNWSIISVNYIISAMKTKNTNDLTVDEIAKFSLEFEISFEVFSRPEYAANTMQILLISIKPEDVEVTDNFYYNSDDTTLYWGCDALEEKIKNYHKMQGNVECPICGRYVSEKVMDKESGYCNYCKKHSNDIVFH
jgi:hypothetical protein